MIKDDRLFRLPSFIIVLFSLFVWGVRFIVVWPNRVQKNRSGFFNYRIFILGIKKECSSLCILVTVQLLMKCSRPLFVLQMGNAARAFLLWSIWILSLDRPSIARSHNIFVAKRLLKNRIFLILFPIFICTSAPGVALAISAISSASVKSKEKSSTCGAACKGKGVLKSLS